MVMNYKTVSNKKNKCRLFAGHLHIVEHLIGQRELVGKQERIDALELLGATFVDKKRDMLGALKLWKRAMEERYSTPGDGGMASKLKFAGFCCKTHFTTECSVFSLV